MKSVKQWNEFHEKNKHDPKFTICFECSTAKFNELKEKHDEEIKKYDDVIDGKNKLIAILTAKIILKEGL